jgi:hypothetical protein
VPSPYKTERYCVPQFAQKLDEVMQHYQQLLPEYLTYLIDHDQLLPPEWIPRILYPQQSWIRQQWVEDLLDLESMALGDRVTWMVEQGLPIKYAVKQLTHPIRSSLITFKRLRRVDPAQARAQFEAIGDRQIQKRLIPAFRYGLSMADEPLLESCLDHASTRQEAADLLVWLPESRLIARNLTRLEAYVTPTSNPTWRLRFQIPKQYDEGMLRDGIEQRQKGKPNAYWWLQQMFQRVPLVQWHAWGFDADMWAKTDPVAPVFQYFPAYVKAAIVAQDTQRLRRLFVKSAKHIPNGLLFEALSLLTFAQQCDGMRYLASRNLSLGHILRSIYGRRVWTLAESELFLAQFQLSHYTQGLEDLLLSIGLYLNPTLDYDVLERFCERTCPNHRVWPVIAPFQKLMRFRRQLHQCFFAVAESG